jgi:hypothetical protein
MGSTALETISSMSLPIIFLTIIGALYIFKEIVTWVQYIMNTFGLVREGDIEKKEVINSVSVLTEGMAKLEKSIDEKFDYFSKDIYKKIDRMQFDIGNVQNASKEELSDKINIKFKTYFKQGYIPFDEYDDFVKLHCAYKGVGGNHSGDARFEKCIQILPVIDDSTDEMRLRFLEHSAEHSLSIANASTEQKAEENLNADK